MIKKNSKPTVFISYCRSEINYDCLNYFVDSLKEICGGKLDILIDTRNTKVGDDINQFSDKIKDCICVIVIMTPSYKIKVLEKMDFVYSEFKVIINKMNQQHEIDITMEQDVETSPIARFEIIPILFSGDIKTSVPKEFKNLLYEDFRELKVSIKKGKSYILKSVETKFQKRIKSISEKITASALLSLSEFQNYYEEYFKTLFKESKSEWSNPEYQKYIDDLFVKTDVFKKVMQQDAWFIVGRKGSGKSTITDVLPQIEPDKYLTTIPIYADNISLVTTYNIFTTNQEFFSDSKNVYQRLRLFQYGWELFLFISCMYKLVEMYDNRKLSYIPIRKINRIKRYLRDIFNRERISHETDLNVIFTFSFSKLQDFIEIVIKNARPDMFGADLTSPMAISIYREFLVSKKVLFDFYEILEKLDRKILLSFDGIDTIFDLFRKDSIRGNSKDLIERSNFEVDWLNSLLLLILNQGVNPRDESRLLYKTLHYCITIPKDRFLEVRKVDRDTFRHHGRFAPLNWSGIELSEFLRKRLEHLENVKSNSSFLPEQRLNEILDKYYQHIPKELNFEFNGRQYKIPLFFYILRHTFWRPRDILFYYANILSLAKELKFKKSEITSDKIRHIVKLTTIKVIKSEFINEFSTSYDNIEEVINKFRRQKQVLSYIELSGILKQVDIRVSSGIIEEITIQKKIEFLYQIGFLGIVVSEQVKERFYMVNRHAFIFNESSFVFDQYSVEELEESSFVIHPVFCEHLQLDTKENDELILQFDWDYLHTKEWLRNVAQDF